MLQQRGAGAFVMVDEGGDGKGRYASNVTRVRAHFVDLDGAPIEPVLAAVRPHIVVGVPASVNGTPTGW